MIRQRLAFIATIASLSFQSFTFGFSIQTTSITGFSPSAVCSGSSTIIQVTGSGFTDVVAAKIGVNTVSYNIVNDSTLEILNTSGASTGHIVLETTSTTLVSPNQLTITALTPTISANMSGVVCEGTSVTYTASGGSFYEFFIDGIGTGVLSPNNSVTFNPTDGQNIYAIAYDTSMNCSVVTNVITAQIETISTPQLISSSANITVCNNEPLSSSIIYSLTNGANDAFITGLPPGISAEISGSNVIISGTANVVTGQDYNYVITPSGVACVGSAYGTISVTLDASLEKTSSSGNISQTLCEGNAIDPISFTVGGGATNATVTGLPSGVTSSFDATAGVLSIEGTPTDNIASESTYNYTVTTSGSGCNEQVLRGTITVQPLAELSLLASSGALDQVLCEGEAITPILIALQGGTDIASISGLPAGIDHSFDNVTKILSVSGTPTADISSTQQVLISFATTTACNTSFLTGSLTINQQSSVELISHLQTQNQLVCGVTPIEKIEYQLRDGATNATISGLPAGVTWSLSSNIIEIIGIPENVVYETAYDYTIVADGNGCPSSVTSSIVVTPNTMDMPVAEEKQYFCVYDAPTLMDIEVYANNLKWYSADGLVELDPTTSLVDGEVYYAHNEVIISEASAIDRYACRSFATPIEVIIYDTPAPQILEPTNNFCNDGFYTLADLKTNVDQVVWYSSTISENPLVQETPLETNTYYAAAIDPQTGCESTTRTAFDVVVNPCSAVVYNALSVNGDGLNEKLIIENIEYFTDNELVIYNRNGSIVFRTTNYGVNDNFFRGYSNINGTLGNNKVLPMGTYFYTFSFVRPSDGELITENGFINLVAN